MESYQSQNPFEDRSVKTMWDRFFGGVQKGDFDYKSKFKSSSCSDAICVKIFFDEEFTCITH